MVTQTQVLPAPFIKTLGEDYAAQLPGALATKLPTQSFAPTVAGYMALPQGEDFHMLEGNKTRFWTWVDDPADIAGDAIA